MSVPANIADKIALANTLATFLDGTDFDLAVELAERNLAPLATDPEFNRLLAERLSRCPSCNDWVATEAYCGCDDPEEWDDEE